MVDLVDFFQMLSDETRFRILVLLFKRELCVCEICDILDEPQPKVSRHLAKLRDAGLVRDERQGQWIFYYPNIQNELMEKFILSIVNNPSFFPPAETDLEKLQKKLIENKICLRETK